MTGTSPARPIEALAEPRRPSRWVALSALCLGLLMVILDGTIVSIALPAIQADLGFSPSALAWTVNAYLLPLGGLLLLAGRLGDLLGRRRVLLTGLVLFVLASILCGLAPDPATLIGARFAQGAAAALASAVVLGMVVELFPEPAERAKAMGVYAFVGAAGASIGVLLGGVLTETAGWPWIFWVNVPIGLAAVLLIRWAVAPDGPRPATGRPDVLGGVLVTAGLVLAVLTIVDTSGPAVRTATGVLAAALLVAFVLWQRRVREPLVRLGIFASRAVSGGNAAQLLTVAGMLGFQFIAAQYLQNSLGYEPAAAGLAMLPIPLVIAAVSLALSGRLIGRFGAFGVLVAGQVLLVVGLLALARPPVGAYALDVLPSLVVLGIGAGLSLPAVTTVMMSDATPADAGLASGLANTSQQVGGALGTAVLAAVAAAVTGGRAAAGTSTAEALGAGYRIAFVVAAVSVAAAVAVAVAVVGRRPGV
ncbi:MFS transporter [Pseudonocardia lacus]|uniref:MFS transporter n=1 Tax=Pseudonocardia lacus TaxID=2835865 RepID=UPI001BDC874B|nr:MFS transporter [Pseudonocardia lacus]